MEPTRAVRRYHGQVGREFMKPSTVIWNWKEAGKGIPRSVSDAAARKRGVIQAGIGAGIGVVLYFVLVCYGHSPIIAYIAWSISGIVLLAALLSPGWAYAGIEKGIGFVARWVGLVMTVVLLTPIFFLFFMPFRFLFRLGARDRLMRKFPGSTASYWVQRQEETINSESYRRQF